MFRFPTDRNGNKRYWLRPAENDERERRGKMSEPAANGLQSERSLKIHPDPKEARIEK